MKRLIFGLSFSDGTSLIIKSYSRQWAITHGELVTRMKAVSVWVIGEMI